MHRALPGALVLAFLPWNGCDQGGNYSTGNSSPTCQTIYQPAAAAETRFAAKHRDRARSSLSQEASLSAPSLSAVSDVPEPDLQGVEGPQGASVSARAVEVLTPEAKRLLRDEMAAAQESRTHKLIQETWLDAAGFE
eukprot:CAMPEP_0119109802 /NCGR_PEP_ID=MMETSP1180-20130426/23529_1 /TAXON_ID=3052 ORGANISM="Chlamydomonas cf sp, Strain CCMP681" /NCGR_SAMPLE_ID=MMETSP1180 /ASSEMBLY_ACC=CAM_ASM_000741 /LENGTH=136 /DNA_ID=CAMNT_0007095775 /DNA_START=203 /DNA_END=613 /DNA_ORIENTATION=-